MKLYYSPGSCSLASHITLQESGAPFRIEKVNLRDKVTETGADFRKVNPRGSVPALELEDGTVLTEGVAIMQFVADSTTPGALPAAGTVARARVQEMLNYVTSEVHKLYSPFFGPAIPEDARAKQMDVLNQKLGWLERQLADGRAWLAGDHYTPADAYLFVVTNWSKGVGHDLSGFPQINALRAKVAARPAVQAAMTAEGLIK